MHGFIKLAGVALFMAAAGATAFAADTEATPSFKAAAPMRAGRETLPILLGPVRCCFLRCRIAARRDDCERRTLPPLAR